MFCQSSRRGNWDTGCCRPLKLSCASVLLHMHFAFLQWRIDDVSTSCLCVPPHSGWTATHFPFQAGVPWKLIDCLWIPCLFPQTLLWVLPWNVSVTIQGWMENRNWRSLAPPIPFAGSHHVLQTLFYRCLLCLLLLIFVMTVLSSVLSCLVQHSREVSSLIKMASIHWKMHSSLAQRETQWMKHGNNGDH